MTLDIPGEKVFVQRDVRETPASTATATSVGLTDLDYVLLSTDADVTNERVLTMGEGLDMTDNGPGLTIVISGEHATDTGNKGISTYDASDFDVAAGVVTIDDSGVDHDAITNTHNMTTDIDARITPGEAINYVTGTISCELATSANRGVATFATTDFVVTTGDVALGATVVMSIDGDSGTATPAVHNIDILGGTGIDTLGANNDITISMEAASTSNVGGVELTTAAEVQTGTDTTRAVTADAVQTVLPPIGAVMAWMKSMTSVPATLPTGWAECDGSTISDAQSPMNGEALPDLNGGEFLRGDTTSGGTGGSATMAHTHDLGQNSWTGDGGEPIIDGSGFRIWIPTAITNTTSAASNTENRPPYYNVVWIMRIK